ncbi:TonB-dependent receptor, partial [Bowmanella sp. Y57]|nr:TonB-dependent receptor [Bowmanella yangjiangensis]
GYSQSTEKDPGGIAGAKFVGDFTGIGFDGSRKPHLVAGDAFYDPTSFELDEVEWEKVSGKDKEKNIRLDLARDYDLAGNAAQVKFGGKLSRRDKTSDTEVWVYDDFTGVGLDGLQS